MENFNLDFVQNEKQQKKYTEQLLLDLPLHRKVLNEEDLQKYEALVASAKNKIKQDFKTKGIVLTGVQILISKEKSIIARARLFSSMSAIEEDYYDRMIKVIGYGCPIADL